MSLVTIRQIEETGVDTATIKLLQALNDFSELIATQGHSVIPYTDSVVAHISSLPVEKKEDILVGFLKYSELCSSAIKSGVVLKDTVGFIKYALKYLGKHVAEEFYATIGESDIVEIYSEDHIQIFRNISFFKITDYSIAELISYEWEDLYYRSSAITKKMYSLIEDTLASDVKLLNMDIEPHFIKEIRADTVQLCEVKFRYIAPIYTNEGEQSGYTMTCYAESKTDQVESDKLDFI